jgi:hypothetical protein
LHLIRSNFIIDIFCFNIRNLGIINADPQEYQKRYGSSLLRPDALPDVAIQFGSQPGLQLAATHRPPDIPILEGDIQALRLIDLDSVGLGHIKDRIGSLGGAREQVENQCYSAESVAEQHYLSEASHQTFATENTEAILASIANIC